MADRDGSKYSETTRSVVVVRSGDEVRGEVDRVLKRISGVISNVSYYQRIGFISDLTFCSYLFALVYRVPMTDGGFMRGQYCRVLRRYGVASENIASDMTELPQEYKGQYDASKFAAGLNTSADKKVEQDENPMKILEQVTPGSKYKAVPMPPELTARHRDMISLRAGDFASFVMGAFVQVLIEGRDNKNEIMKFLREIPKMYQKFKSGGNSGSI